MSAVAASSSASAGPLTVRPDPIRVTVAAPAATRSIFRRNDGTDFSISNIAPPICPIRATSKDVPTPILQAAAGIWLATRLNQADLAHLDILGSGAMTFAGMMKANGERRREVPRHHSRSANDTLAPYSGSL